MKKLGFTIWELLAVIIIILFVAAILFPVFMKARPRRSHGTCLSNMHQLGLGVAQWSQDNLEQLPAIALPYDQKKTWRVMIYPYVKSTQIFLCPDRDGKIKNLDGFPISYAANYTGDYSGSKNDRGNGAFVGPHAKPLGPHDIPAPASLIMLCEVWHSRGPDFNIDNLGAFSPGSDILWAGHTNGGNYVFVDGHAKYLKPLDTQAYWHRDNSIPLSPGSVKVLQNAHKAEGS